MGEIFLNSLGCPEISSGVNCTETWKEYLDPWSSTLIILLSCFFGLSFLNSLYYIWHTFGRSKLNRKLFTNLRFVLLLTTVVSNFCLMLFFALGGMLTYEFSTVTGKVCLFALAFGGLAFFQATNILCLMYLAVLNKSLKKKGWVKFVEFRFLKFVAVPWPAYLGAFVFMIIFMADIEMYEGQNSSLLTLRIIFGLELVLFLGAITINAYYYRAMSQTLFDILKETKSLQQGHVTKTYSNSESLHREWEHVATFANRFSLYAVFLGTPIFIFNIVAVSLNMFIDPVVYFVFTFGLMGFGIFGAYVLFVFQFQHITLFRKTANLSSSKSSDKEGTDHPETSTFADDSPEQQTKRDASIYVSSVTQQNSRYNAPSL